MSRLVPFSAVYGPRTQSGVAAFHDDHPQFRSVEHDPGIGPRGWAYLMTLAYAPEQLNDVDPPADYHHVIYGGQTVNVRTRVMLERARVLLTEYTWVPRLSQGSYNPGGVAASGGTHDGGGVVDIIVNTMTATGRDDCLRALRRAGFAAWLRTPAEGFPYHIHAVAIGDREMSKAAAAQVRDYFAGRNGLANHGPDTAPAGVGRPLPPWAVKFRQ
jgi:hypothetical protein